MRSDRIRLRVIPVCVAALLCFVAVLLGVETNDAPRNEWLEQRGTYGDVFSGRELRTLGMSLVDAGRDAVTTEGSIIVEFAPDPFGEIELGSPWDVAFMFRFADLETENILAWMCYMQTNISVRVHASFNGAARPMLTTDQLQELRSRTMDGPTQRVLDALKAQIRIADSSVSFGGFLESLIAHGVSVVVDPSVDYGVSRDKLVPLPGDGSEIRTTSFLSILEVATRQQGLEFEVMGGVLFLRKQGRRKP